MKADGRELYSDALERTAIGLMLTFGSTKAVFDRHGGEGLLYRESSRWGYRAIDAVTTELGPGAVFDGAAIVAWMTSRGVFKDAGGGQWLRECMRSAGASAMAAESVAAQLRELRDRRDLMRLGNLVRELAWDGEPMEDILGEIQRTIGRMAHETAIPSAHEVARQVLKTHDALMQGEGVAVESTGLPWLDYALGGGVSAGHSYYLCGLWKIGKTKLGAFVAWALLRQGWAIHWYSVEMDRAEMMTRLLSCEASVSERRIAHGSVKDPSEYERFLESVFATKGWTWRHQMRGKWTAEDICADVAHQVLDNPHKRHFVVVDYVQDVGLKEGKGWKSHEVVSGVSRSLNSLSKQLNVPVLVLSQLTLDEKARGATNKYTPMPSAWHARGSKDLLQHANHLLIVHRPWWQMHDSISRFTVLDLALTRSGGTRRVYLHSDLTRNRYAPWEDDVPQPFEVLPEQPWRADVDG